MGPGRNKRSRHHGVPERLPTIGFREGVLEVCGVKSEEALERVYSRGTVGCVPLWTVGK